MYGPWSNISAIRTIASINKRQIKLSDGSIWNLSGISWGVSGGRRYAASRICKYQDGDEIQLQREIDLRLIDNVNWRLLSAEKLISVAAIIRNKQNKETK